MNVTVLKPEEMLTKDPIWSAYALADLEPQHADYCTWHITASGLLLIYAGLEPPVLFMQGRQKSIASLLPKVNEGLYQFSALPAHLEAMDRAFLVLKKEDMLRMVLAEKPALPVRPNARATRLDQKHLDDICDLFAGHPDAPDAFRASQLVTGVFFGIFQDDQLIALAGTHVRSPTFRLAAIGNVFTHPDHRGNGYASITTQEVVRELLAAETDTIVLNVARSNSPAKRAYERIGFRTHCEYVEGYVNRIKR